MGCNVEGCERDHYGLGWCEAHYDRVRKTGEPGPAEIRRKAQNRSAGSGVCTVAGCDKPIRYYESLCAAHYARLMKTGDVRAEIPLGVKTASWNIPELDPKLRRRRSELMMKYGITPEEYAETLESQRGGCAICGSTEPKHRGPFFVVDHCHTTGKVRGLLCSPCNTALGLLGDDPKLLRSALRYLKRAIPVS